MKNSYGNPKLMTHGRAHKTSGRLADKEEPTIDKFALAKLSAKTYFRDANY